MTTNCVAVIETLSPATGGDWITVYAELPTDQTSQVQLGLTRGYAWFRSVNADNANAPINMVLIPAGSFQMGDSLGDAWSTDELPVHTVYVETFYMDRYEVTNDEIVRVMQWAYDHNKISVTTSSVRQLGGAQQELLDLDDPDCRITWDGSSFGMKATKGAGYPCVEISWYGAAAYCNYRSEMEGLTRCYVLSNWSCDWNANGYRLPTEAEWEKGARGGLNGKRFSWGDTITHGRANYFCEWSEYPSGAPDYPYDDASEPGYHPDFDDGDRPYTSPVGHFAPNGYGLYDMTGNVWEWCWDWYSSSYYGVSPGTNPHGPASGNYRIQRGGAWSGDADYGRCAARINADSAWTANYGGFRCVRGP